MYLFEMTPSQIDAAAERHFDRMLEEYQREDPEPWEINSPDWEDIACMVDCKDWKEIISLVRDYVEGDGDLMEEIYKASLLDAYIAPEDEWMRKDPDDEWTLIDRTFGEQWDNDDLFRAIYLWMPKDHHKAMCERLMNNADNNGFRDQYNKDHADDYRYGWED